MNKRTALELAEGLDRTFVKGCDEAEMLRSQAAEIERLKRERHHIYDLLARIHRDGGQYTADNGVEKACDDAEAQVVAWLETLSSVDALIEHARIAEREAWKDLMRRFRTRLNGRQRGCAREENHDRTT